MGLGIVILFRSFAHLHKTWCLYVRIGEIWAETEIWFATDSDESVSLWVTISTDFRNIILLKQNTAFVLTWQENVSTAFVTNINRAAPIISTWSFSVCCKTNVVYYCNVLLEMYQHMYPVIICHLHVGIQTISHFVHYSFSALSDFVLRFMVKCSSIKTALLLVMFRGENGLI